MSERLIGLKEAADRLGINKASVRLRRLGTEHLTHIRPGGGKRILLVESEVDELIESFISRGRQQTPPAAVKRHLRTA